jgi:cell division protein FtsW (lipid II flippase)
MVYIATDRIGWVVVGSALFAAGSVAGYDFFGHVRIRVHNWINSFAHPDGTGYQMVHSLFSFATGRFWRRLGKRSAPLSKASWLPGMRAAGATPVCRNYA